MGITGQGSCLFSSIPLQSTDIYHVVHGQYKLNTSTSTTTTTTTTATTNNDNNNTTTTTTRNRPRVVIDANPIGYPFIYKSIGPARAVVAIAKEFVEAGIDVIIVCDNKNKRHHSKRATILRRGVIERGKIQLVERRIELANLLRFSDSVESLTNIQSMQKEIKKLEKGTGQVLPTDFIEQIQQQVRYFLSTSGDNRNESIEVIIAPFQADTEVARRVICGDADCIVSIDSDYQMMLGSSTPTDMTIRHVTLDNGTLKIKSAILVTGQQHIRDWIMGVLPVVNDKSYFPREPSFPIFDDLSDPPCRAMLAVAMGSDVFCGGLNKFGPQKAFKIKQEIENLDSLSLKQHHIIESIVEYKNDTRMDKASLLCYTQALLYELTCNGYMYGHYVPKKLDTYVKEFKYNETTTIEDGVSIRMCPGLNNNDDSNHTFIPSMEGEYLCHKCNKICCPYCTYDIKSSDSFICIQCKNLSLSTGSSLPTEKKMRQELRDAGTNVPGIATYIEIVDMYEDSKADGSLSLATNYSSVMFPLEPPSVLDVSQNKLQPVSEPKIMKEINHFIHDDTISASNKVQLIRIMAAFVDLSLLSSKEKKIGDTWKSIIPKAVLHIANNSRLHEGEKLCKSGVRHTMDKANPAMLESTVSLCTYNNNNNNDNNNNRETAIRIKKKVMPSMKSVLYDTEICFNYNKLIACSCTCKAGCRKKTSHVLGTERNFCTHGASILIGLSMLLFDGLAEHILVELRARLSYDDELGSLLNRHDIFLLMTACGRKSSDLLLQNGASIFNCLEEFSVGTDLSKSCRRIQARTTPREYCLLRNFELKNPQTAAANIITSGTKRKRTNNDSDATTTTTTMTDTTTDTTTDITSTTGNCTGTGISTTTKTKDTDEDNDTGMNSNNNDNDNDNDNEQQQKLYEIDINEGIGTIDREEYKTIQCSIEGLNQYLYMNHRHLLTHSQKNCGRIIGYSILQHRSNFDFDMTTKCEGVTAFTTEWKESLRIGTGVRYSPKKNHSLVLKATTCKETTSTSTSSSSSSSSSSSLSKRKYKTCCVKWCTSTDYHLKCIPVFPKVLSGTESNKRRKTHAKKAFVRREFLERLGLQRLSTENETKDLRYCSAHTLEEITKPINVCFDDGTKATFRHTFLAPVQTGIKSFIGSPSAKLSKGTGTDRSIARIAQSMADECSDRVLLYDTEMQRQHEPLGVALVNETVGNICGIHRSNNNNNNYVATTKRKDRKTNKNNKGYKGESSLFDINNLTTKEVKRRTGFSDISSMLSYVIVVCGGSMHVITNTGSKLTWLEEWMLYLEYMYGHSMNRWIDYAKEYNLDKKCCRRVFRSKLMLVIVARKRWPMYATHEEDKLFRNAKWSDDFGNTRVIMHDNTNIGMPKASDGDQQRSLFSEYYNECCAKGGVCIQLCGWIRATHLVTGHACDKMTTELTQILPQQQQFQEHDKQNNNTVLPFLLVLDKGYRITAIARKYKQNCRQPIFAKSDEQFQRDDLLLSAGVAVNRSGNERGVKYMKHSWIVRRGIKHGNFNLATIDDIWLAWGFQVNFMYKNVL